MQAMPGIKGERLHNRRVAESECEPESTSGLIPGVFIPASALGLRESSHGDLGIVITDALQFVIFLHRALGAGK